MNQSASQTQRAIGLLGLLACLLLSQQADAQVWKATQQWSGEWEERYAQWIEERVNPTMLAPVSLAVDCADLCYVIRAIFARNHRLPFMASDAQGNRLSHQSSRWNHRSTAQQWRNDQRFLAFLNTLKRHVTTKSFPYDTYPVALTPETIRPGLVLYENLIASHSCFIAEVSPEALIPVVFFEASVPPQVQFKRTTVTNIMIYEGDDSPNQSGVVAWNWPEPKGDGYALRPDEKMPHYALEIYQDAFAHRKNLSKALNQVVKQAFLTSAQKRKALIEQAVQRFKEEIEFRRQIVSEAWRSLQSKPAGYRAESFTYMYGTESRDQRLYDLVLQILRALDEYELSRHRFLDRLADRSIEIVEEKPPVPLLHLFYSTHLRWIQSDAYLAPAKRWGLRWDGKSESWHFRQKHSFAEVDSWYRQAQDQAEVFQQYQQAKRAAAAGPP